MCVLICLLMRVLMCPYICPFMYVINIDVEGFELEILSVSLYAFSCAVLAVWNVPKNIKVIRWRLP